MITRRIRHKNPTSLPLPLLTTTAPSVFLSISPSPRPFSIYSNTSGRSESTLTSSLHTLFVHANSRQLHLSRTNSLAHPPITSTSDTLQTIANKEQSSNVVVDQLRSVRKLQNRVSAINSPLGKISIISEYPNLRPLLELIYHPRLLLHMTPIPLRRHLASLSPTFQPATTTPHTLLDLFSILSSRVVTGSAAKDLVASFLLFHGIMSTAYLEDLKRSWEVKDPLELETFMRLLERNLVAGFGLRLLNKVEWPRESIPLSDLHLASHILDGSDRSQTTSSSLTLPKKNKVSSITSSPIFHATHPTSSTFTNTVSLFSGIKNFSCALGNTVEPPFKQLFTSPQLRWFASRKLDGVRCLALIDYFIPTSSSSSIRTVDISFLSRSGKAFFTLSKLETQLRFLEDLPELQQWLEPDLETIEQREDGVIKRLVLDGEVCVMRELTKDQFEKRVTTRHCDDHLNISGAISHTSWESSETLIEDFPATVSQIRRQSFSISHPAYFLLDVLSWCEVNSQVAGSTEGLGLTFGERVKRSKRVVEWLNEKIEKANEGQKCVKMVGQCEVKGKEKVDEMVGRAAKEGWEGLVFRADRPYKGRRSSDILKFKQWKDAEYTVTSIDTATMRLAVDGVYGDYNACSNVWILHKGVPVSVGSGFTAEQRLRYARDPGLIVGKQITVEYFAESESNERDKKAGSGTMSTGEKAGRLPLYSLRFPRVKQVWEEGQRSV